MYHHRLTFESTQNFPVGKAVCVGRNYLDHIQELNNSVPTEPLLFMKGNNAFAFLEENISIPAQGECHNELEVALLVGKTMSHPSEVAIEQCIAGIGLGLDLTLRDKQTEMKSKGYPWERAKAFDGSLPLSKFVSLEQFADLQNITFQLKVNGEQRQSGNTGLMIHSCQQLLQEIVTSFSLYPGDVVLTGTPKGVGPLLPEDELELTLENALTVKTKVKRAAPNV